MPSKVAIITGASSGLGAATARLLAQRGWAVVVNYLNDPAPAERLVRDIRAAGGEALAVQGDATDPAAVAALVRTTVERYGRVDAAIANANIPHRQASVEAVAWHDLRAKVDGELAAVVHLAQACVPVMRQQGAGRLVIVSSLHAHGPAAPGMVANGTAKAAVSAYARYAAWELGRFGIRVNLVAPSMMNTPATQHMPAPFRQVVRDATPLGHIAEPDEVARVIAFLVDEDGAFLTGAELDAGGGFGLSMLPQLGPEMADQLAHR